MQLKRIYHGRFYTSKGFEESNFSERFGLRKRNERGTRLLKFCKPQELIVSNTYFEVPLRKTYTWKAQGDRSRYQIDFMILKIKFRNQIKSNNVYSGYDIDSDHNIVMAKCNIKFKKRTKDKRRNSTLRN